MSQIDTIGPFVMVTTVIVGIVLTSHYINTNWIPANPNMTQEQGLCVQRQLGNGRFMIEFGPNGLIGELFGE